MNEYEGKISLIKGIMPVNARRGYNIWRGQRRRCYSKIKKYKPWWGKNIVVEYNSREFIYWFLKTIKNDVYPLQQISVGRIDHDKNYSFDNIEIVTKSENSKEARIRNKINVSTVTAVFNKNNDLIKVFDSILSASKYTKINTGNISRCIRGIYKSNNRFIFKEVDRNTGEILSVA